MNEKLFEQLVGLRNSLFSAQQKLPLGFRNTESELETDLESLIQKVTKEMEIVRDTE